MIEEEIDRAKWLYAQYGEALTKQDGLGALFNMYRNAIRKTQEVMKQLRVVRTCSACASEGSGSCCFQGVEEWYDHILLLINLVLGRQIPELREVPGGCLFVGSKGCKLIARHSFCVNYLCPSLKDSTRSPSMERLLAVSGDELFQGWGLEKSIRDWLQKTLSSPLPEKSPMKVGGWVRFCDEHSLAGASSAGKTPAAPRP
jgi:hypothetical protein